MLYKIGKCFKVDFFKKNKKTKKNEFARLFRTK